ncbi:PREDICTED: defensin-like protein 194 [Camelina sativa]|uniref:Defensin-like protein 194 n=1 Tax=Camelina sativa TaxID=90675 RepID=A0ABM0YZR1_CAMSA|nr:PREDICTED: defensin-like protein 194 [Camelina sativa]
MSMATKSSVSTLAIFVILFLVISEISEIQARDDDECLKEYIGAPPGYCLAYIYPSLCYHKCQLEKGAKGGKCNYDNLKCFCDFCSDKPHNQFLSNV